MTGRIKGIEAKTIAEILYSFGKIWFFGGFLAVDVFWESFHSFQNKVCLKSQKE